MVHAKTRRRKGKEKDNFLLFFFAALRLCVIKNARDGCAGPHLSAMCDKNGLFGYDNIAVTSAVRNRWECCLRIASRLRERHAKAEQLTSTYQLEP